VEEDRRDQTKACSGMGSISIQDPKPLGLLLSCPEAHAQRHLVPGWRTKVLCH
jgi:hypothetical protein